MGRVLVTGHGDIPTGITAMKSGVIDFLPKPFSDTGNDSGQPIRSDRRHNFYRNQAKTNTQNYYARYLNPRDVLYRRRGRNYIEDPSYLKKIANLLQA